MEAQDGHSPQAMAPTEGKAVAKDAVVEAMPVFPSHQYSIAGTWTNFSPVAMHWDGSCYVHFLTVGNKGWESFQILQGGKWEKTYYPSVRDGNPHTNYRLCGPDDQGTGKNWTLGIPPQKNCNERNAARTGDHYRITVEVDREWLVTEVNWKHIGREEFKGLSGGRQLGPRRVLVLRHGSRPDTIADPALDLQGFAQAKEAAKLIAKQAGRLGVAPITAIFSSPFLRTLQTATPVSQVLALPIRVEEGFCELLAHQWLHTEDPLPALGSDRIGLPPAGFIDEEYNSAVKPTYPEVVGRLQKGDAQNRHKPLKRHKRAIKAALAAAQGGSLLVVGHGATHDFVAEALCPQQHLQANHTPHCVEHCAITELLEQDGEWHLVTFGASTTTCKNEPAKKVPEDAVKKVPEERPPEQKAEPKADPVPPAPSAPTSAVSADATEPAAAAGGSARPAAPGLFDEDMRKRAAAEKAMKEALPQEAPEDQTIWVVVGGGSKSGIVARSGVSLHSRELPRLRTGARVVELGLTRERLHYRKLDGDGPDFGWVSIRQNDIALMKREDELS